MISKIELKNFRCFEEFTLDGIAPITLIAGGNNVGKTALLESLFFYSGYHTIQTPFAILNSFRGIQSVSPETTFGTFFFNNDMEKEIIIDITYGNINQNLILSKDDDISYIAKLNLLTNNELGNYTVHTIKAVCNYDNSKVAELHYVLRMGEKPQEPSINPDEMYIYKDRFPYTHYLTSRKNSPNIANSFSKLVQEGKKDTVIEAAKLLDTRIKDLYVLSTHGVPELYADLGAGSSRQVNFLGDGTSKLLLILFAMMKMPNGIILIDEIENGFHYTFLPKLWEVIGKLVEETGCQVFATTHDNECIEAALPLAEKDPENKFFRYVRLDNINGVVKPQKYDNNDFDYAATYNWEVR